MVLKSVIKDGRGTGNLTGVSSAGELTIGAEGTFSNKSSFRLMNVVNQAFNLFPPISGKQLIITSIAFDGNANSTVSIYEATNSSTTTIDRLLFKLNLRTAGQIAIPFSFGGFLAVTEGEFVNALTDTQPVNINVVGYYHQL